MSKSKLITKIKEIFSEEVENKSEEVIVDTESTEETFNEGEATEEVTEEVKEAFLDVTTDEGVMVRISEPVEVGSSVEVIDEEGEVVGPAPDGEHSVEGVIVITLDGVISEIIQPAEEEVVEEEVVEASSEEVSFATEESLSELSQKVVELEAIVKESNEVMLKLVESFSKFSKEPNGDSIKTEAKFSSENKKGLMSKEDKIKFFSNRKRN